MKCGIADVGSNSIRLSIYRCEGSEYQLLFNKKETAGLAGYVRDGALSREGMEVACTVLAGFRDFMRNLEIPDLYLFATASLRNITNSAEAVAFIHAGTGLTVEILSGRDEASFSFLGALSGSDVTTGLLTDIGGGSTELVGYRDGAITDQCSLPIGSLALYAGHVEGLFPSSEERRAMRGRVEKAIGASGLVGQSFSHLTAVGGTARAAARLCGGGKLLPAEDVRALYKNLKRGDQETLRRILKACPERVHTLLPGLMILHTILKTFSVETVAISANGVREGYLLGRILSGEEAVRDAQ